ncbi:hypothetical protein ABIE67_009099 [Streptomyces sp. V4I8]
MQARLGPSHIIEASNRSAVRKVVGTLRIPAFDSGQSSMSIS